MLTKTEGFVLNSIKYSETSIICKVYTHALGLRTYIINSVRTNKPKHKAVFFQPLTLLNLVVYERENKDIQRIKEYQPIEVFQSLPFDIFKSSIALFITEILNRTIKEQESNPHLYDYLKSTILYLEYTDDSLGNFPLYFLLQLSRYLGFGPQNNYTLKTPYFDLIEGEFIGIEEEEIPPPLFMDKELSKMLSEVLDMSETDFVQKKIKRADRRQLFRWLLQYYGQHIENFKELKSVEVLEAVLG